MPKPVTLSLAVLCLLAAGIAQADEAAPSLFNPARYMRVSEVRPGMKGYGLSVFSGTKIEKFDVDVVDVVKDFNPKYDAILIRCPQEFLKNTGPIAGMSGSPIYLYDAVGRAKMVGAFAYGWPLAKDCLAGVQPIEYMLALPKNDSPGAATSQARNSPASEIAAPRWALDQVPLEPWGRPIERAQPRSPGDGEISLEPLATPLMAGGISERALERLAPLFQGSGLRPMQVGTGIASAGRLPPPKLEPGSVLAIPLLTGDMELTAVGTCTERIGDRIFGFGHPFNSEGIIDLPVGSGSIATVVPNLAMSFKLGFLSQTTGALLTDQTVGVAGMVGRTAPMIPLEVRVIYADGSVDQTYHFNAALHPKLTPLIAGAAVTMALTGERNLPEYHTVDYELTADFANGQSIHITNSSVNGDGSEVIGDVVMPIMAALDNPFKSVALTKLTGTVRVSQVARSAQISSVMVARTKYEPREIVKAYISYQPFHAQEAILPVELELPPDLPNGTYQLIVSDWMHYLSDERTVDPLKFTANNIDELFSVVKDVMSIAHNSVYLRLVLQADGVAVGHTAMPHLPSSQRQAMLDAGRSDITPFVTSAVKIVPAGLVMSGVADFTITVERHGKVEVPSARAENQTPPPTEGDESNRKSTPAK